MKQLVSLLLLLTAIGCSSAHKVSKIEYSVVPDDRAKILKGVINRSLIETDSSFAWFKENMKWGEADADAVRAFKEKRNRFTMVVVGGTWCEDTQNLLPKFFRLVDKSGYAEKNILLIGVDRKKQTINDLHKIYHIESVPTFIVLKDGKEIGRVVEYGKSGNMEKELGAIVENIH
jgi:thiol-disulfide isomerase/thioredoxin